jgi:hypothetical protein
LKKKEDSEVVKLARFFVMDFLGQDDLDYRRDGMHLRHAKMLLKPTEKNGYAPKAYKADEVITCLQAMIEGVFRGWDADKTPNTMLAVLYGTPPFIERLSNITDFLPPRPPFYEKTATIEWNRKYAWLIK